MTRRRGHWKPALYRGDDALAALDVKEVGVDAEGGGFDDLLDVTCESTSGRYSRLSQHQSRIRFSSGILVDKTDQCGIVRTSSQVPTAELTGRSEEEDEVGRMSDAR